MRRVGCGLVKCSKTADFRLSYCRFRRAVQSDDVVLTVNRCREHRHVIPRSAAKLVKIATPWPQ